MLDRIAESLPNATRDSEAFHKASSQFKSATLDVVDLTPISAARHLLAIVTQSRQALEEADINLRRKRLELKRLTKKLNDSSDDFDVEETEISIDELNCQIENIEQSARGAVRRLHFSLNQYQQILDTLGIDQITEELYEFDQARYHVMTAFNQALTAARARGGLIDEGNHIYLFQLGINGAVAQMEVNRLLGMESEMLSDEVEPSHELILDWLNHCADKYADSANFFAKQRFLETFDETSLFRPTSEQLTPHSRIEPYE